MLTSVVEQHFLFLLPLILSSCFNNEFFILFLNIYFRLGKQGSAFWISFPYRPDHMSIPEAGVDGHAMDVPKIVLRDTGSSTSLTLDISSRTDSNEQAYLRGQNDGSTEPLCLGKKLLGQGQADRDKDRDKDRDRDKAVGIGQIRALELPIKLPTILTPAPSYRVATSKMSIHSLSRAMVPLRILIVEDSLPIMKVVCSMLKQKGPFLSIYFRS